MHIGESGCRLLAEDRSRFHPLFKNIKHPNLALVVLQLYAHKMYNALSLLLFYQCRVHNCLQEMKYCGRQNSERCQDQVNQSLEDQVAFTLRKVSPGRLKMKLALPID
jgi:hypothetical protein